MDMSKLSVGMIPMYEHRKYMGTGICPTISPEHSCIPPTIWMKIPFCLCSVECPSLYHNFAGLNFREWRKFRILRENIINSSWKLVHSIQLYMHKQCRQRHISQSLHNGQSLSNLQHIFYSIHWHKYFQPNDRSPRMRIGRFKKRKTFTNVEVLMDRG